MKERDVRRIMEGFVRQDKAHDDCKAINAAAESWASEREKEERRRGFEAAKKRAAEAVKRFLPTEIRRFAEATLLKEIESLTDDGKE